MRLRKFLLLLPFAFLLVACNRDPKAQAQRYVENGNKFFEKAKYKEASIMYRRALQQDLRFGEAYYRLALTQLKLSSYGDAARALRRAVELQPDNADAASKLADIYMIASTQDEAHAEEMKKEARDLADKLLQQHPDSFDGHRLLGQLAFLDHDSKKAVEELQEAYRLKKTSQVSIVLFQALISSEKPAEALKFGREIITNDKTYAPVYDVMYAQYMREGKTADAEAILNEKIENNSKQPTYLLQLLGHYMANNQQNKVDEVLVRLTDEKKFPEGHMLAGDFFQFRLRAFDLARSQYEAGMKAFPQDKAAYQKRIVELLASTGKNPDANNLLNAIISDNPKDNDAIAMRAALMLRTGNAEQINQAANDLQSLVTKSPDNHLLRFNLATAHLAKNDVEQARLQLEAAIKIRTDFIAARQLLARIFLGKGDSARALKEADEIIALSKNDLQAHLIRSSALLGIGDKSKAQEELATIDKISPNNPDAHYQAGYLAWETKDFKGAEKVFGELYRNNPKDIRGLVGVVETLMSQNNFAQAVKIIREASDREPNRNDLRLALANVLVRNEQYDESIQILQKLLAGDPKSGDLLLRLAEVQRRKGDVNTAMETFRRATQAAPNDPRPLLQLGLLMDGTGRREQAKPIYEQLLKIQPDHPIALNNLAYIKAEEGSDLDEALTMAQRARQKMPESTSIQDTLGWIYIKKNLSDDAVRVFRDLVKQDPTNPSFRYHYGMALLQKGDKPSARQELEAAIRNKPSKDDSVKIRQLLAAN
ncbi:MAG: tetratricopeptide repeat protein [Bryobacteraceae bacterium]